jgi:hypothetical protein
MDETLQAIKVAREDMNLYWTPKFILWLKKQVTLTQ